MSNTKQSKAVVIGGSAGCILVIKKIIEALPPHFATPLIIVIHRQRNVVSEMAGILSLSHHRKKITEPNDKEAIANGGFYLAPQNYHLLIEEDKTFSLDYSEPVHYSRPSIDVTFESAAHVYQSNLVAVLLSGSNTDGTNGLREVLLNNGTAIVQQPETADYPTMPLAAIQQCPGVQVLHPEAIASFIINHGK